MPYTVKKTKSRATPYAIVRKSDGKVVGHSASRRKAEASIRARMANERRKK